MTRRKLALYLAVGIIGGLFLSACAGVATGSFQAPAAGDMPLGIGVGPQIDTLILPSFDMVRPAESAVFMFEKASLAETLTQEALTQQMSQAFHHGGLCARLDD